MNKFIYKHMGTGEVNAARRRPASRFAYGKNRLGEPPLLLPLTIIRTSDTLLSILGWTGTEFPQHLLLGHSSRSTGTAISK
jgi:hypothetical protein